MLVVYHHDDLDGISAAAVLKQYTKYQTTTSSFNSFTYNDEFNKHTLRDDVVILDLSFGENTYEKLLNICNNAHNVIWIDHHSTSIELEKAHKEELQSIRNLTYFINDNFSGAVLSYLYFHLPPEEIYKIRNKEKDEEYNITINMDESNNYNIDYRIFVEMSKFSKKSLSYQYTESFVIPEWLALVDDYDCWKHKKNASKYFQLGVTSEDNYNIVKYDENSDMYVFNSLWDNLEDREKWFRLIEKGKIIYNYLMNKYKEEFGMTFVWEYDGKKFLCKNGIGNSYHFVDQICNYDAAILFHYNGKIGKWKYSIYSDNNTGMNCREFAEKFNGGGHTHASGFTTEMFLFTHKDPQ